MIDKEGFRPNVGIIICNDDHKVLWAKRVGQDAWQFPQGGVHGAETPEEALYRELHEEVGLKAEHVKVLGCTKEWLRYRLPHHFIRHYARPLCLGQKQKWFLLQLLGDEREIHFDVTQKPEFDHWNWVDYWYPVDEVIQFKRVVYRNALKELEKCLPKGK